MLIIHILSHKLLNIYALSLAIFCGRKGLMILEIKGKGIAKLSSVQNKGGWNLEDIMLCEWGLK